MINNAKLPDRKFVNKLLDMVFAKDELRNCSAKGNNSHGKSHIPLDKKKLVFVQRKCPILRKEQISDTNPRFYYTDVFQHFVKFDSKRSSIFLDVVNKKCNNARKKFKGRE